MHHILPHLKSFSQALLIFIVVACALDWWRKPNQPASSPNATLSTLTQNTITLNQISRKQTAILYFWGSWCSICRYTSPTIEKLHQDGIPVISVALKSGSNPVLQNYLDTHQLSFPTVNDSDGLIADSWQVKVTPTVILIKNGRMLYATTGFSSYWGLRTRLLAADLMY